VSRLRHLICANIVLIDFDAKLIWVGAKKHTKIASGAN
jgi:hypothetical protein